MKLIYTLYNQTHGLPSKDVSRRRPFLLGACPSVLMTLKVKVQSKLRVKGHCEPLQELQQKVCAVIWALASWKSFYVEEQFLKQSVNTIPQ